MIDENVLMIMVVVSSRAIGITIDEDIAIGKAGMAHSTRSFGEGVSVEIA